MKIAILGTRGVPNNYGGFEQCAEKLSAYIAKKGHDATVYNPSDHVYEKHEINGVKIKYIFSNEKLFSFFNVFIFDYLCLKDAKDKYDLILELGYHPASIFYYLKEKYKTKIITNMAGMEWKRSKWNYFTRKFIKYCELLAVKKSNAIITDNLGIMDYFLKEYGKESYEVAYGAELYNNPKIQYIEKYGLKKNKYYLMIARFQRDNNFEMILNGFTTSGAPEPFVIIGDHTNTYGKYLKKKYNQHRSIKFLGGIYNYDVLSSLRWFSKLYFHGHSCGGTNPSLLEAMASNAYIAAHNNPFNRNVLEYNAIYFSSSDDVSSIICKNEDGNRAEKIKKNREKIKNIYNWDKIFEEYLQIFEKVATY
jgi:glycosyltransferase involved in cell wall biosynthesis